MGSSGITQIGSFTVYSVGEDGEMELLGTLDEIESVEVITETEPEEEGKAEIIFSLLQPDTVTFTAQMTVRTRIGMWFWQKKLEIQKWLTLKRVKKLWKKIRKLEKRKGEIKDD
jgi:hypothetical protein